MYERFTSANQITSRDLSYHKDSTFKSQRSDSSEVEHVIFEFGGCSIDYGLFRFHTFESSIVWNKLVEGYFADYTNKFQCFGFDWMGRQFAKSIETDDMIYMFDPATFEVFCLDQSLQLFLNEDLVEYKSDTFNDSDFKTLILLNGNDLGLKDCLGFTIPLFLGGNDTLSNYTLIDMEVYWEMTYQVFCKTRDLPGGAVIDTVQI